jgi:thiol-disulfide isomerase/thioredoxin
MDQKIGVRHVRTVVQFEGLVKDNGYVLVKFEIPQCKPCKNIMPTLNELGKAHPNLMVLTINSHDPFMDPIVDQYAVTRFPTFHFFRNGSHLPDLALVGPHPDHLVKQTQKFITLP